MIKHKGKCKTCFNCKYAYPRCYCKCHNPAPEPMQKKSNVGKPSNKLFEEKKEKIVCKKLIIWADYWQKPWLWRLFHKAPKL